MTTIMTTQTINTLEDLLDYTVNNDACYGVVMWLNKRLNQPIEKVFQDMPVDYMVWILQRQPQFGKYCDFDKLDGFDWSTLLSFKPQLSTYCDFDKLKGDNWSKLLSYQPQFSMHCDWNKLESWSWASLLIKQPQFSIHCDWNKLNSVDWRCLLKKQPQFKKFKK